MFNTLLILLWFFVSKDFSNQVGVWDGVYITLSPIYSPLFGIVRCAANIYGNSSPSSVCTSCAMAWDTWSFHFQRCKTNIIDWLVYACEFVFAAYACRWHLGLFVDGIVYFFSVLIWLCAFAVSPYAMIDLRCGKIFCIHVCVRAIKRRGK